MFNIPEEYQLQRDFDVKSIIPKTAKYSEKKRMRDNIKSVKLEWQISGEKIPSRIDDYINCQVIMFFSIQLTDIKHASIISKVLQHELKPFVIIRFFDATSEVYSFAIKRLHANQKDEVVVENEFITTALPTMISHSEKKELINYTSFDTIQNKLDKYNFYIEIASKAYIVSNKKAFTRSGEILSNKLWFNRNSIEELQSLYNELVQLKNKILKEHMPTEKIKINTNIKHVITKIDALLEG